MTLLASWDWSSYPSKTIVLLSDFTNSSDEVFVECDGTRLVNISKVREDLRKVTGEPVGIMHISTTLFSAMLSVAEDAYQHSLHYDHESDYLVAAIRRLPVHCRLEPGLAWAEIDDESYLVRARASIYPEIVIRDALLD